MARVRRFRHGDVARLAEELIQFLAGLGINVTAGSCLERMTLSTWDVIQRRETGLAGSEESDYRRLFGDMLALAELGIQILGVRSHPSFETLRPHLALLNRGEGAQNRRTLATDQEANKIFELLTACYFMKLSGKVLLEDPDYSEGDNPDVIASLDGGQVGIACKVLHSSSPKTFLDHLEKGIAQIEASPAQTGFVFVSLKNVLDYEKYWPRRVNDAREPEYRTFTDPDQPIRMLEDEINSVRDRLVDHVLGDDMIISNLFSGKKAAPLAMLYGHIVTGFRADGVYGPASIKFPSIIRIGEIDPRMVATLKELSHIIQRVPESSE